MVVYLDILFLVNAAINYLMLLASARIAGEPFRRWRLIVAAALGGIYAVAAVFPRLGFLKSVLIQIVAMVFMVLVAFDCRRKSVRLGTLFLAISFCFGGIVFAVVQLFGTGMLLLSGGTYYPVSFSAILLMAAVWYLVCHIVFCSLAEHTGREFRNLSVFLNGEQTSVRALHDTGNTLKDPISNERVMVLSWQVAARLLPQARLCRQEFVQPAKLMQRLSRQYPKLRFRLIPFHAVGIESGMLLAVRCEVKNDRNEPIRQLVAFTASTISDGHNFEALMGG